MKFASKEELKTYLLNGLSYDRLVLEVLFERAWEESHSDGYKEVEITFDRLLDIYDETGEYDYD